MKKKNNFDVESEPTNENNENSDIKKMIWMILIYIYQKKKKNLVLKKKIFNKELILNLVFSAFWNILRKEKYFVLHFLILIVQIQNVLGDLYLFFLISYIHYYLLFF